MFIGPTDTEIWVHLGDCRRKQNNIEGALEAYEKSVDSNKQDPVSLNRLGIVYKV